MVALRSGSSNAVFVFAVCILHQREWHAVAPQTDASRPFPTGIRGRSRVFGGFPRGLLAVVVQCCVSSSEFDHGQRRGRKQQGWVEMVTRGCAVMRGKEVEAQPGRLMWDSVRGSSRLVLSRSHRPFSHLSLKYSYPSMKQRFLFIEENEIEAPIPCKITHSFWCSRR